MARQLSDVFPKGEKGKGTGAHGRAHMELGNWAHCHKDCWKDGGTGDKVSLNLQEANAIRS